MFTVPVLEISDGACGVAAAGSGAHEHAAGVEASRVVLAGGRGCAVASDRCARLGWIEHQVGLWRRRFEAERLAGLDDRPRPGRPRIYGHDERLKIVETVTATTPEVESQWSHRLIAEALSRRRDLGLADRADPGRLGSQAAPRAGLADPPR